MTCKDCGATVTETDRFCPACGTPNLQAKFHPRFAPALRIVEPRIVQEIAPPGSPSCPRCHRLIRTGEEHCGACGMDLAAAWERIERVHQLEAWKQRRGLNLQPYRSPEGLTLLLQSVLAVGVVLATGLGALNLWLSARATSLLTTGPSSADLYSWRNSISYVALGVFVVGFGIVVGWMHRTYLNLTPLAVGDLRFDDRWAVLGWFVPGFNLIRPKQVVDDIWRASHPLAPPFSSSWRVGPPSAWSAVWWSTFLVGGVLAVGSWLLSPQQDTSGQVGLQVPLAVAGVASLLLAMSALVLQMLARRISDRQVQRAKLLLDGEIATVVPDEEDEAEAPAEVPGLVQPVDREVVWGRY